MFKKLTIRLCMITTLFTVLITCKERSKTAAIIGETDDRTPVVTQQFDTLVGVFGHCNAFRSGSGEIITAHHCLPQDGKLDDATFTTSTGQKIPLLSITREYKNADVVSFAIQKGDSSTDKAVYTSGKPVTIVSANPFTNDSNLFLREVKSCHLSPYKKGLFLHDCDTEAGASGSPVLQNGFVIGVHIGYVPSEKKNIGVFIDALESADLTGTTFIPETDHCGSNSGTTNKMVNNLILSDYFPNRTIAGSILENAYAPGSLHCSSHPRSAYIGTACIAHDRCYVTAGTTKKQCDDDLFDGWVAICRATYRHDTKCRGRCERVVHRMWKEQRSNPASVRAWNGSRKHIRYHPKSTLILRAFDGKKFGSPSSREFSGADVVRGWHWNGKTASYVAINNQKHSILRVRSFDGRTFGTVQFEKLFTKQDDVRGWNWDGKKASYITVGNDGKSTLYIRPFDGRHFKPVQKSIHYSNADHLSSWSWDGKTAVTGSVDARNRTTLTIRQFDGKRFGKVINTVHFSNADSLRGFTWRGAKSSYIGANESYWAVIKNR